MQIVLAHTVGLVFANAVIVSWLELIVVHYAGLPYLLQEHRNEYRFSHYLHRSTMQTTA